MPILDELAAVVATRIKATQDRCQAIEQEILRTKAECELIITRELARERERIAVLEARSLVPGPQGADGAPGKDGVDGKDGEPGPPGKVINTFKSRYMPDTTYVLSDLVKEDGSTWICKAASTTERPGKSSAWEIFSMRGDRGRDAKDPK